MAENNFLEPEEQEQNPLSGENNDNIQDNFDNPLGAPVIEKNYTRSNVRVEPSQLDQHIPEPAINAEIIDLTQPKTSSPPPPPEQPKEQQPFNPQMGQLPRKDKRDAAERAVDAVLDGYAFLKSKANYLIKINEGQVKRLEKQGKVNLKIPVPYDEYGNTITLEQYIQEFNKQNEDNMEFDAESRAAIRPVMIKYFEEQGIGMTVRDELIYLSVKELLTFGAQIWVGLQVKKDMVKQLIELTQSYNNMSAPPVYSTPPPPPPPPPAQEQGASYQENVDNIPTDNHEDIIEHEIVNPTEDVPLAMMGANNAALKMTGAIPPPPPVTPKRRGRLKKADAEKVKQQRIDNNEE